MRVPGLILLLLLFSPWTAAAPDPAAYEQERVAGLAEQIDPAEFIWLQAEGMSFAGLYRATPEPGTRAVVLLHGMGAHADWPGLINTLRTRLPAIGWTTLSIQLPVLSPEVSLSDYGMQLNRSVARVRSAVNYLKQAGYTDIGLVGHGFGASVAVSYLTGDAKDARALAAISLQEFPFLEPPFRLIEQLARVNLPVLDIYASQDFPDVLRSVDDRRLAAMRAANNSFQQLSVADTDHYLTGRQNELADRITFWLVTIMPVQRQSDLIYL